jgi:hypothetical protein
LETSLHPNSDKCGSPLPLRPAPGAAWQHELHVSRHHESARLRSGPESLPKGASPPSICQTALSDALAWPDLHLENGSVARATSLDRHQGIPVSSRALAELPHGALLRPLENQGYPTLPSKLTPSNFCASTANSIGRFKNTCLQKPFTIMLTASSADRPRCLQ